MVIIWHLLGSLLLVALLCAGLLVIPAPVLGLRVLKSVAAVFGAFVLGLIIIQCCFVRMMHLDIPSLVAFWTISVLAYFYCERTRPRKQPNRRPATSAERELVDARRGVIEHPTRESEK
jgi:hypothetical protein